MKDNLFWKRHSLIGVIAIAITSNLICHGQTPRITDATFPNQIAPMLWKHCNPCHYGRQSAGGLKLETMAQMLKGGVHGPAIILGKANESRLVLMMEGKVLPAMPPIPNAKPLDTTLVRAWIDAG